MEQVLDSAAIETARRDIRAKVVELARRLGAKPTDLKDDEIIPETGLLDSAAIMELVVWFEMRFDVTIDQADLTIDNFGTINAMVDYLTRS
jgi:acyl carrier protein